LGLAEMTGVDLQARSRPSGEERLAGVPPNGTPVKDRAGQTLDRLDPAVATRSLERLGEMLVGHMTGDGVWFDSRAWIVTARRY
jgi:hypothetical protein